jgi:hypothetical protein
MSSLQKFAKAVVEGDLENISIWRRESTTEIVVERDDDSDRWNGSVGAWQAALSTALVEVEVPRLRDLFRQAKPSIIEPIPPTIEPIPMQFPVKSTASHARLRLGNIRLSIRDIEEDTGDRDWHLASLAQEIHDVLKSDELAPEARSWVESVHRKYFPAPEAKSNDSVAEVLHRICDRAEKIETHFVGSGMRQPHTAKGAIKDFVAIIEDELTKLSSSE